LLISCAAAEAITTPVLKWVFKTPQNDANAVRWIFGDMKNRGLNKIGVLHSNTGFGKAGKGQLEKLAPEFGIEIAIAEEYDKAAVDLDDVVTKIKAKEVEAVVNWSIEPAQSKVPVSMRKMGWMVPLYQSHGFGNIKYAGAAGRRPGIFFPASRLLVPACRTRTSKALLRSTRRTTRRPPEDASTFSGATPTTRSRCSSRRSRSAARQGEGPALEGLKGFVGARHLQFLPADHNGLGMDAFELLTVRAASSCWPSKTFIAAEARVAALPPRAGRLS
jgi:branched-chain amino acid transport system substrate-binding protein